ncbi:GntR family transcriptional regulator [Okibacterium endophyticum]
MLPGEQELARHYAVSRGTIRRVLAQLADEALIATKTGIGSFVVFDGQAIDQSEGWGRSLAASGARTTVTTLRMELVDDPALATATGAPVSAFLALDRVRLLDDGTPISLERSRVPAVGRIRDVPRTGLVDASLTRTLVVAGLRPTSGEQEVGLVELGDDDAIVLEREAGTPFLQSLRTVRDRDGALVERVSSLLDPRHFRVHLTFGESR